MSAKPGGVFLSSVQGDDFDGIRNSAREAAEQIGWAVKRAEETPPSPDSSRDTIRRRIEESDVVISMLGERAGTILENGMSVVEDEYRMAREIVRPVIVILQRGVRFDARQGAFVGRLRGDWEKGHWAPKVFEGPADVGLSAIVPALVEFERRGEASAGIAPLAREALETILDSADRANQRIVGAIIDEIQSRRGRTDDISFRTMFDVLAETPEFFVTVGDIATEESERIGAILVSSAPLLLDDGFAQEHRNHLLDAQRVLRRFRDSAGQANFVAGVEEPSATLVDSLRRALDRMHDGLFERQHLLADVRLAILESEPDESAPEVSSADAGA